MTEYRLLRIRRLMNNEHLTHSNVDERVEGDSSPRDCFLDHRLGTNDPERPSRPQRGSLIEQRKRFGYHTQDVGTSFLLFCSVEVKVHMAPQQNRLLNKQEPGMTEYRLLRIRRLMNNEHLTNSNVDDGVEGVIVHQEIVCPGSSTGGITQRDH
ncbi:hypothetical protein CEXT_420031 [Caerostris extrusa]|uniref:Uncharacterized protein n=1 Tax=Caerostris extrusa TaxID=172846 RepID=A0AAV4XEA2_CAEEX|nr:hypothetical protein CEXT_420031 [Caerostris extrusa]